MYKCQKCDKQLKNNTGLVAHKRFCVILGKEEPQEPQETIEYLKQKTQAQKEINDKLDILIKAISKLVKLQQEVETPEMPLVDKIRQVEIAEMLIGMPIGTTYIPEKDETINRSYVPPRFREVVNSVLNSEFDITITEFDNSMNIAVNIFVPDKYSSITKEDREKGVKDIRTKIITRMEGENGVKNWCELIRKNLNKYFSTNGVQSPFQTN